MSLSREDLKVKAQWCEQAERYDDLVKEMTSLVHATGRDRPLDEDERNLLNLGFKHMIGERRMSWRVLNAKVSENLRGKEKTVCLEMKKRVEEEIRKLSGELIRLLDDHLIPNPRNIEAKIFFLKMKGDYYRYIIEVSEAGLSTRTSLLNMAENSYQDAMRIATAELPPTSPVRLGLVLNYSVFTYEIKGNTAEACDLAQSAFDEAILGLEDVSEKVYKDSTFIIQLLRDNLSLWRSETEDKTH